VEAKCVALGKDFFHESLREEGFEPSSWAWAPGAAATWAWTARTWTGCCPAPTCSSTAAWQGNPGGRRVVIIGGGNTAIDCARTCWRLGAKEVTVFYRRSRSEMPANDIEVVEAETNT
jgi:NADPH-dependent 2,4-dienoyl-CoA reductase/sulfur reductase-like enzyme